MGGEDTPAVVVTYPGTRVPQPRGERLASERAAHPAQEERHPCRPIEQHTYLLLDEFVDDGGTGTVRGEILVLAVKRPVGPHGDQTIVEQCVENGHVPGALRGLKSAFSGQQFLGVIVSGHATQSLLCEAAFITATPTIARRHIRFLAGRRRALS